jgi:hypothetical protein
MTQHGTVLLSSRFEGIGLLTPRQIREWTQLVLGAACVIQQLVAVSFGQQPEILVWSGGVALLGATLLGFADAGRDKGNGAK